MRRPRPWVIIPGIWNSDPEHWQSRWQDDRQTDDPTGVARIAPSSWGEPDPDDWSAAVSRAVAACGEPPLLIAHSLGVLAVAEWLRDDEHAPVAGAFLVAPPDPTGAGFPDAAAGFVEPSGPSDVPTVLVVSDDDPYCATARALGFAGTLGARVLRVGALGHVNVTSGIGAWPDGRALLTDFERSL